MSSHCVFVAGATGYLGRALLKRLGERGHTVRALVRPGAEHKLAPGCVAIVGQALAAETYAGAVAPADTFVHLVGTARPSPWKARQFEVVDLASVRAALAAAKFSGVRHFVYVSVAQPAPIMRAYLEARRQAEDLIRASGLCATILRPWYVLGPGHSWPLMLLPVYALLERLPATRASAQRLGFVSLAQMIAALVRAIETPARDIAILDVPQIRVGD